MDIHGKVSNQIVGNLPVLCGHRYFLPFASGSVCNRLTQHLAIGFQQHIDFQQHTAMKLAWVSQHAIQQLSDIIHAHQENYLILVNENHQHHEEFHAAMRQAKSPL
jgi:hypothetical protein